MGECLSTRRPLSRVLDVCGDGDVSLELSLALVMVEDEGFELAVESFLVVEVGEVECFMMIMYSASSGGRAVSCQL